MKISKYVYSKRNKVKGLAVHTDDCVTCLLFKTDVHKVVDRLEVCFL